MISPIKMSTKDQILLNLISTPISFKKKDTLNILLALEKKYPDHLAIKRRIIQFFKINNQEELAVYKLI